ncbi:MAG TPA: type II toxin-antitoxin system RelE/ParE family toxin, partial [Luteimonas sp.]|nr:type II toxin-antitoxin system RelE/ParE family toxin [Luteimonas sp.]
MSDTPRLPDAGQPDRRDRLQRWGAAAATVALHGLLLLLALWMRPDVVTPPQGAGGGGSGALQVTWIEDIAPPAPAPTPAPVRPVRTPTPPQTARAPAPPTRVRTTPVVQADDPLPPEVAAVDDAAAPPPPEPVATPAVPTPSPPDAPDARERPDAPARAESPPQVQRPARMKGLPPGMRLEDLPASRGPGRRAAASPGPGSSAGTSGASLGVDGYQVYYELVYETRLRAWRDQGMTELFLPLPGTRRLMVCPLEIALRRGSGAC